MFFPPVSTCLHNLETTPASGFSVPHGWNKAKEGIKSLSLWSWWKVAVKLTFSRQVQMIFDSPFPLFQLLGQLSVFPAWASKLALQISCPHSLTTLLKKPSHQTSRSPNIGCVCRHSPFFILSMKPSFWGRAEAECLILSGILNLFLMKGCLSRATWPKEKQLEVSQ